MKLYVLKDRGFPTQKKHIVTAYNTRNSLLTFTTKTAAKQYLISKYLATPKEIKKFYKIVTFTEENP